MSNLSIAYIFQQQQLLVDQDFQLPQVERLHNDLALSSDHKVIAPFRIGLRKKGYLAEVIPLLCRI